jgi:hypothetical protein
MYLQAAVHFGASRLLLGGCATHRKGQFACPAVRQAEPIEELILNHSIPSAGADAPSGKTPYAHANHSAGVTLNPNQALYVIPCGEGYSCLGYENARNHAQQIADLLGDPSLSFTNADFGQLSGYEKHQRAIRAWCNSAKAKDTYFDPGTAVPVRKILERYRRSGDTLRVVLGDPETGRDWMDENDGVGTVGRSMGPMRVPLMVAKGERGGPALLTRCIVRLIDWETQRELYVHPRYQSPALAIVPNDDPEWPWEVTRDGQTQARFDDVGRAGAYIGFMRGLSVDPRCFQ